MSNEEIVEIKRKLAELENRVGKLEKIHREERGEEIPIVGKPKQSIERLAEKIGISTGDIEKTFDLEERSLTLVSVLGKDDTEKTKNATLLVLLGYKYLFGMSDVLSQEIRRNVAENRIPLNNFSSYINEMTPSLVRRKGKTRSPKTTYRLTTLGEAEARELFKQSVKKE